MLVVDLLKDQAVFKNYCIKYHQKAKIEGIFGLHPLG